MKKLNVVVRYILYLLPFIYLGYCAIVYKTTGSTSATSLFNDTFNTMKNLMSSNTFFSGFFTWFNNNISNYSFILYSLAYCCYLLLIEFVILIKNVLMYLFNVANAWLEKGVDLGK